MMDQLKVLRRIKDLREQQALRLVNAKRRETMAAEAVLSDARKTVSQSAATLPTREDAIYRPILRQVVGFDDVEEAKANVQALQTSHSKLIDNAERAEHVRKRVQKQLDEAIAAHRKAIAEQDKYTILADEVTSEWRSRMDHQAELEIEDLLISRRSDSHD
jgi:hypothetical protein